MVSAGLASQDGIARSGGQSGALGQGQENGHDNTLFDSHHRHHCGGEAGQPELEPVEAPDPAEFTGVKEPSGDEDQDGGQRGLG